jgi:hypothetical protein
MNIPVAVILIRENSEQLTGGGCCGALTDDDPTVERHRLFREARQRQEELGLLHRAVRRFFPPAEDQAQVEVETVDPRNQLYLIPRLLRDVLRYRPGWRAGLMTALQWFSLPAVVVNGRVISRRGEPVDPDTLCHTIKTLLDGTAGQ